MASTERTMQTTIKTSLEAITYISANVADWLVPATIKTLLSADGIVPVIGFEEIEEAFHFRGVSFEIYETLA